MLLLLLLPPLLLLLPLARKMSLRGRRRRWCKGTFVVLATFLLFFVFVIAIAES